VTAVQVVALLMVAGAGTAVALTRDPERQAVLLGVFGVTLAVLFFAFQGPDVALAEIVVSGAALPAIVLLALAKAREHG
jgi:uncharacterized MnhB-related membrane protein